MDRRAFLKLLGWSLPSAAILTSVQGFDSLMYQPALPAIPADAGPLAVVDFKTVTRRVAVAMHRALGPCVHGARADYSSRRLGDDIDLGNGWASRMERQLSVGDPVLQLDPCADIPAVFLDQYGQMMADMAKQFDLRAFAPLMLPVGGVVEAINVAIPEGPIVRGVLAYNVHEDRMLCRFDALGGRA